MAHVDLAIMWAFIAGVSAALLAAWAVWLAWNTAAQVDRSPKGQDAEGRLGRNDESAVTK